MYIAKNPRRSTLAIRQAAYSILRMHHPRKLSASEIAEEINLTAYSPLYPLLSGGGIVSPSQVRYALDGASLRDKRFARFPSYSNVLYFVYVF